MAHAPRILGTATQIVKPGDPNFTSADDLTEGGIPCLDHTDHWVLVSINTGCVLKVDLAKGTVIARLDLRKAVGVAHAGGIDYHENGGYVVMGSQCLIYVNADLTEARIVKHLQCRQGTRLNDGGVTPNGGLLTGSLDFRFDPSLSDQRGKVHMVTATGHESWPLIDIGLSNGLIFNGNGNIAFHVDSFSGTLWNWKYYYSVNAETLGERTACSGDLLEGRGFTTDKPQEMALLDGLGATEEDLVIIARWGLGDVIFFDPENQEIVAKVQMPEGFPHPTHAALGGYSGKDMLICSEQGPQSKPGACGLFTFQVPDDFPVTARKTPFLCKLPV